MGRRGKHGHYDRATRERTIEVLLLTFAAAVLSSLATNGSPVGAADYPAKPVKMVVPFPPGGGVDVIARTVAQKLSARLGGQFYVENLPGAGGDIGTVAVTNAAPDGHTVLFVAPDFVTSPLVKAKAAYDPLKNFAPVSLVATAQEAITVHPSVTARNVGELLTLIKSNPNQYTRSTRSFARESSTHTKSRKSISS